MTAPNTTFHNEIQKAFVARSEYADAPPDVKATIFGIYYDGALSLAQVFLNFARNGETAISSEDAFFKAAKIISELRSKFDENKTYESAQGEVRADVFRVYVAGAEDIAAIILGQLSDAPTTTPTTTTQPTKESSK